LSKNKNRNQNKKKISIFFVKIKKLLQADDKNHQFATAPFICVYLKLFSMKKPVKYITGNNIHFEIGKILE